MKDFKDSVMIALLPISSDWTNVDLPHMTLVYAGEKDDLSFSDFNEMTKEASDLALLSRPLTLRVSGVEIFGDDDSVDVFRVRPSQELMAMRRRVEKWNKSEYPFRPHVTIGPVGSFSGDRPMYIAFDRILVSWGDEHITFKLGH
jgi:2'-5' RNA ligase